ncbi:hypothetical protein PRIPAC_78034 [Pristionchus pacificus]|uniref:Uncharacterized protein n=1 Tax=Pristionchus pacificus TaxID=54126 RepID=A0A2A6CKM1_PRIPA|nr:hypothetical protein PRIPAC_78034 [Pristionchus pacificus]|eukprot:PDM78603.1 hypothetical protein PRIPAC_31182 [Pristionchus pacificus]
MTWTGSMCTSEAVVQLEHCPRFSIRYSMATVVRTVDYVEGACGTVLNCAVIYLLWHRKQSTKLLSFRICNTVISLQGLRKGACGTVLNCAVLYLLWHRKRSTKLLTYRICVTVISLQGILLSVVVVALSNIVHLFHPDAYLIIAHGYIASFSEHIGHFLVIFSLYPTLGTFLLVPGACLLHYLTLCKPHISKNTPLTSIVWSMCRDAALGNSWQCLPYFLSSHSSGRFTDLVREVHHTATTDQFVTLAMALMPTDEHATVSNDQLCARVCDSLVPNLLWNICENSTEVSIAPHVNGHHIFRENARNEQAISDHANASGITITQNHTLERKMSAIPAWSYSYISALIPLVLVMVPFGVSLWTNHIFSNYFPEIMSDWDVQPLDIMMTVWSFHASTHSLAMILTTPAFRSQMLHPFKKISMSRHVEQISQGTFTII